MTSTPRVSLGMPVFDGERYLAETLACLRNQSFDDYELLISDNASSDMTAEICHEFMREDPRIGYVRNDRNMGAAFNYNQVFHLTAAPYFKWVSYDDLLTPDYLEICTGALDDAPAGVALCYPRAYIIDGEGEILREHDDDFEIRGVTAPQRMREFAKRWNLCNPCFGLLKRDYVAQTRLIEPYISSDVTFLAELAMRGEFWEIPHRLFYRRVHATSSRQGDLSLDATAEWFAPGMRAPRYRPETRVIFEILRSTGQAGLGRRGALRTAGAFTLAWSERRGRAYGGQLKQVARRGTRQLRVTSVTSARRS